MRKALYQTGDFIGTGRGFGILIAATLGSLFLIRSFVFPGTGGDDGEQLIFSQFFDWGYQLRNPPLYTWLVIASTSLLGPTVAAVAAVKFTALAGAYYLLWWCARRILKDQRLGALAAASPLAIFYVAWDAINGYSHSILVMCLYLAILAIVLRIEARQRLADFAALGILIGLGLLSKYAFALFLIALLAAAGLEQNLRRRLFRPALLISFLIALVIVLPHLFWLVEQFGSLSEAPSASSTDNLKRALKGLGKLGLAVIGFLSPLWLILALFFPKAFKARPGSNHPETDWARFFERYFLVLIALAAIAILTLHMDRLRTHYMFVLIPMPIYFFLKIKASHPTSAALRRFGIMIAVMALVSVSGMIIKFAFEPLRCSRCQHHIPYAGLADGLRDAGFHQGTIFAYWHPDPIAGNLRVQFPKSRIISSKHPTIRPPDRIDRGQCLLVWPATKQGAGRMTMIEMANRYLGTKILASVQGSEVRSPMPMGRGRQVKLGYILINPGQGDCH